MEGFFQQEFFFGANTMKDVISINEFSGEEMLHLVRLALELKREPGRFEGLLSGNWLLLLFQKTSTRTRLSFEVGFRRLGGETIVMDWDTSNFAISPIRYEARYVSRHMDLVMARLKRHGDLQALAEFSTVPVINGCDDKFHPCQALADMVTVYEAAGTFDGQTLTYTGIHNNVVNSLMAACTLVGVHLILVTPETNPGADDPDFTGPLMASGLIEHSLDLKTSAGRSQFVYTDTWVDMEFFHDDSYREEKERRIKEMLPFQLNSQNLAGSEAFIMHDMPIHPGYEITEEIVESPRSRIYQQAENRLYAQQALMLHLLGAA